MVLPIFNPNINLTNQFLTYKIIFLENNVFVYKNVLIKIPIKSAETFEKIIFLSVNKNKLKANKYSIAFNFSSHILYIK